MRLTKRLPDGQAVMDCESCGMRERGCTVQYCRNRLKDVLAKYEDENAFTPPIMRIIDYDKLYLAVMDAALSSVDEDTIFDLMDSAVVDSVPVVRCRECGAETSTYESVKEVKEAWNRRADDGKKD